MSLLPSTSSTVWSHHQNKSEKILSTRIIMTSIIRAQTWNVTRRSQLLLVRNGSMTWWQRCRKTCSGRCQAAIPVVMCHSSRVGFICVVVLRRALESTSNSVESYYFVRDRFITTHAVISTCQYILGIGDRHLSNFMIDTTTGELVGIDFGYSFGTATSVSGVKVCLQQSTVKWKY